MVHKRRITSEMDYATLVLSAIMFVVMLFGTIYAIIKGAAHFPLYGIFTAGAYALMRYVWREGTEVVNK